MYQNYIMTNECKIFANIFTYFNNIFTFKGKEQETKLILKDIQEIIILQLY